MTPIVILVRPQLGENIGATARAMSNFGLSELRLVAPRDGWPNKRALEMSSGGQPIIERAQVFPDFASAIADIECLYATTARARDMEKPTVTPPVAMTEIATSTLKSALVLGPERTGLENEEITLCDTLITIPTSPENSSLNIAQSAVVLGYEWFKTHCHIPTPSHSEEKIAPKAEWLGLFTQLEAYLDEVNYYRVAHKKTIMWQNLKTMLMRGQWSEQELRSFRGMLRSIWERREKNREAD